ncbi:MAG: discoidin domain-containing protein [Candidatus Hydrogenedentes bacterium]|nr:discoidin domain-containing protein [Candidatus Hydrogenedentota bacterium]
MNRVLLGALVCGLGAWVSPVVMAQGTLDFERPWQTGLAPGQSVTLSTPPCESSSTYSFDAGLLTSGLAAGERVRVEVTAPGTEAIAKDLHAGDPGFYLPFRAGSAEQSGAATITISRNDQGAARPLDVLARLVKLGGPEAETAFEAEPNDSPAQANRLEIGRTVEGSADDVDYLDNVDESKRGLDWFRIDIADERPVLVIFELDIPDRDVSVNMRCYTIDPADSSKAVPYLEGKDPMEIVHDRERERYSKSISRVFTKGTYYLEVNANHPRYQLRSYKYPVPPYDDPKLAVEVGLRYIMDVGDAWFAQIPREGNIYKRVQNMHETAMRCTACHPSVFSTEPQFVAHQNGYPIQSKSNFRYVVERIYNSITPFYGEDGLWWQRFIAIPLQSQGMQGNVLINFERQISGRETPIVERFGPLMRSAWSGRNVMPEDEQNGVVPLDSEFGYAWRNWLVMRELYRRTGVESYARAADNLQAIYVAPETEARVASLHDRIHFVQGLSQMDREKYRATIDKHAQQILAVHNTDGGWDEEGRVDGTSAVYATGHVVQALMQAGIRPEQEPKLQAALKFLMSQQQPFGGWFQTDTHENFKTPMRESRYALIALAMAYPKGEALKGMGNYDGGPAVVPATDAPAVDAIAALENIWEITPEQQATIGELVFPLLKRPEAPVRAAAAAVLGRVGGAESTAPLLSMLDDSSKMVWREAAWALRQLGNRGYAADALKFALQSADPLTRRSAARAFAYQFQEMDARQDIAREFVKLIDDPDELIRLQALRTLRQWFYRSNDPEFKKLVIQTVIDRMGVEGETPAMRVNLAQNMYILLDENQSGGVSMQRNIRDVPKDVADRVLGGRVKVEQSILLEPVLTAMANGNALQREALLESFDGSFFKGRYYAQIPRNMIDVGNDREFSFMFTPAQSYLDETLGKTLLTETRPAQQSRAIQLATFFEMPQQGTSAPFQLALLSATQADDATLRATARDSVKRFLQVRQDAENAASSKVAELLMEGDAELQAVLVASVARSPEALANDSVKAAVRELAEARITADEPNSDLLPLLLTAMLDDRQAMAVLEMSWKAVQDKPAAERIPVIQALANRPALVGAQAAGDASAGPSRRAVRILKQAATDRDVAVRERVFELMGSLELLRKSSQAAPILYAGLSDDSPAIRVKSLALARENENVWKEEDVHEYMLKLLVSSDPKIRKAALETVQQRNLVAGVPRYAPRVRAVMDGDAELKGAAEQVLLTANVDLAAVTADAKIAAERTPDVLFFRDHVNPYFYEKGADKNACADCHATHTILGLAEPKKDGSELTDSDVINNYRSLLKVINISDPEQSLVLRKPRSPFGTGASSEESPTGVTHVGGTRWDDGTANEAYQAILAFVRSARDETAPQTLTASADSYSPEYPPSAAVDGNPATSWHTEFVGAMPGYPHEIVIALESPREIAGLTYYPRQDSANGRVKEFEIYVSADGKDWGNAVGKGVWENDALPKTAFVPRTTAAFVKLRGLSEVTGQPFMSAAEVEVLVPQHGTKVAQAK